MTHKFFNTEKEKDKEENSEYSDQIYITPSKAREEYIDRSNPITKILLIALGLFCMIGVFYYIIEWFFNK